MKILLTGKPGSGKSRLVLSIIEELRSIKKIAGIITPEIRKNNERYGFKIIDLASNEERILASVDEKGPMVGKYHVNVGNIDYIVDRFEEGMDKADILIIDEIGKMEFFSEKFRELVKGIFKSDKPLIAVIHRSLVDRYRNRGELILVEKSNELKKEISKRLLKK